MASSPPDMLRHRHAWLVWLSWAVAGVALIQVTIVILWRPADSPLAMLVALLTMAIRWGEAGIGLVVVRRLPESDRAGWLPVTLALSVEASDTTLRSLAVALALPAVPALQLGIAGLTGGLCVLALGRRGYRHMDWQIDVTQSLLDLAVLLCAALLSLAVLSQHAVLVSLATPIVPEGIVTDILVLASLSLLMRMKPQTLRAVSGLFWLSIGIRVLELGSVYRWIGIPWSFQASSVATLRAGLLMVAAAIWLNRLPSSPPTTDETIRRTGSRIFWLVAVLSLGSLVLANLPPAIPLLALLAAVVLREGGLALQRRHHLSDLQRLLNDERQGRADEVSAAQQQITTLARLIHDQAAPISGLWGIQRELERGAITLLSARIGSHLDLLQSLSEQLRATLKGQSRNRCSRQCKLDVMPIICAAVDAASVRAALANITLSSAASVEDTIILGDAIALRRILDNLLTNALDATPQNGLVVVEVWQERQCADWLTITVRDSGRGLTQTQQAHIFEPAPQGKDGPGLGLGLAIVRDLAESMHGACGVRSAPGSGSAFWVRLPRSERCFYQELKIHRNEQKSRLR